MEPVACRQCAEAAPDTPWRCGIQVSLRAANSKPMATTNMEPMRRVMLVEMVEILLEFAPNLMQLRPNEWGCFSQGSGPPAAPKNG